MSKQNYDRAARCPTVPNRKKKKRSMVESKQIRLAVKIA